MGRIVVSQFVTLDGVFEDPGGSEGSERGGWAFAFERGAEGDRFKLEEVQSADTLLLGRVTYEGFAAAWPERTDDVGFAEKLNSMPKVVVSSSLAEPSWANTTVVREDVPDSLAGLKADGGEILVNGSGTLVRTLAELDLVDEWRLMVFPVVLGAGRRLFPDGLERLPLRLVESRPAGEVLILRLEPKRD